MAHPDVTPPFLSAVPWHNRDQPHSIAKDTHTHTLKGLSSTVSVELSSSPRGIHDGDHGLQLADGEGDVARFGRLRELSTDVLGLRHA